MDRSGFPAMNKAISNSEANSDSEADSDSEANSEHDPIDDGDDTIDEERAWIKADNGMLQGCIFHDHDQWREVVRTGALRRMMVNHVGMVENPIVRIFLSDAYEGLLADNPESDILEHNEDYLESVGLNESWTFYADMTVEIEVE
tara:strand:- start:329 stop:763 length:435 start_codon:yes stop_codon:yes gene_type:complete